MNEFVSVHTSDEQSGIATLLLSRPPTNALTRQVYREIVSAAADLDHRDDIYAVILFGGHEIFSAGDDMPELSTLSADEADSRHTRMPRGRRRTGRHPEADGRGHHRLRAGRRVDAVACRGLAGGR